MIVEYHRPKTIDEAIGLLNRPMIDTVPLGGGTTLSQQYTPSPMAVVDLQALGLNEISKQGFTLLVGATATLDQCLNSPEVPSVIKKAIELEAGYNLRQVGTLAGSICAAQGYSPIVTVLLALDAALTWEPGSMQMPLGEWLPLKKNTKTPGLIITRVDVGLNVKAAYHAVSRSPADVPILGLAIAQWPSGRTRAAVSSMFGGSPLMAFDGIDSGGVEVAAKIACSHLFNHKYSAEYIQETIQKLIHRQLAELEQIQ